MVWPKWCGIYNPNMNVCVCITFACQFRSTCVLDDSVDCDKVDDVEYFRPDDSLSNKINVYAFFPHPSYTTQHFAHKIKEKKKTPNQMRLLLIINILVKWQPFPYFFYMMMIFNCAPFVLCRFYNEIHKWEAIFLYWSIWHSVFDCQNP